MSEPQLSDRLGSLQADLAGHFPALLECLTTINRRSTQVVWITIVGTVHLALLMTAYRFLSL